MFSGVYGVAQMFRYFEANYPEALLTAYVIHCNETDDSFIDIKLPEIDSL